MFILLGYNSEADCYFVVQQTKKCTHYVGPQALKICITRTMINLENDPCVA